MLANHTHCDDTFVYCVFTFPTLMFEAESIVLVTTEAAGAAAPDQLRKH